MSRICVLLRDPTWWFTAVLVAVLASLAASFLRDVLLSALATVSRTCRQVKQRSDDSIAQQANTLANDETLLVLATCTEIRSFLVFLASLTIYTTSFCARWVVRSMGSPDTEFLWILGGITLVSGSVMFYFVFSHRQNARAVAAAYRKLAAERIA